MYRITPYKGRLKQRFFISADSFIACSNRVQFFGEDHPSAAAAFILFSQCHYLKRKVINGLSFYCNKTTPTAQSQSKSSSRTRAIPMNLIRF